MRTTQKIIPVMYVYEYKYRLGARMAPAAMLYNSLQGQAYLEIVSNPNSYAGYIEIVAAQQQLCNTSMGNVVVADPGFFPPVSNPPFNNNHLVRDILSTCHGLLNPSPPPHTKFCMIRRVQTLYFLRHLLLPIKRTMNSKSLFIVSVY